MTPEPITSWPWVRRASAATERAARRHPSLRQALTVQRRFGAERGANLAAALSMRGFLALFPMLVLAISVVGFIGGDPSTIARDIVDELGLSGDAAHTITEAVETAQRSKVASSIVGVVGLLWAGTGLATAITAAWNQTWGIPGGAVRGRVIGFGWLLGGLVLFAVAMGTALLVGGTGALPVAGLVLGITVDTLLFLWTAWLLPTRRIPVRAMVLPAIVGGLAFEVCKLVGTLVIPAIVTRSSALYGTIGSVFALLVWLLFLGRIVVYVTLVEHVRWLDRDDASAKQDATAAGR
jgi:membrane protein